RYFNTLGLTVLIGWYTGAVILIQVYPAFVPMQYNTALGFLLSGTAILALLHRYSPVAIACGSVVALIGILTLIEYLFNVNLLIDELMMKHYVGVKTSHMGRMAPNTALSFTLAGFAVIIMGAFSHYKRCALIVAILAALILGLGIIAFSGYLTGLESAYGWGRLTRMAVHTAFGFMVLGISFSMLAWMEEQEKEDSFPYWFPLPIAITVLTFSISLWQALNHGPGENFSKKMAHHFVLVFGTVLAFAIALTVNLAQKTHRQRSAIKEAHDELEKRVRERTAELAEANKNLLAEMEERKRAEKELEQKRRLAAMGEMSAHVAHEIRNPLHKVSLSYELLKDSRSIEGSDREALQIIGEEIHSLIAIATDLLDYGRGSEIKKEKFDYCPFMESMVNEFQEKTTKAGIGFINNLPQQCSPLNADRVKIHQLIVNMLDNAIEAMPDGGTLTLDVHEKDGKLIISVSDTGQGIAAEDLENIFMPFFTTKSVGTGLGMAILKQFVDLHGGHVQVDSKVGEGTTIRVSLPLDS
ncbi:MAG: ATP-binding protein, partial [Deltaproteobacteria bacterium]|nr:ATP-binding protein [Deltaproteobacteria bacterium]